MDCFIEALVKKMPYLRKDDIFAGLIFSNYIMEVSYANDCVYMNNSRGDINPLELLDNFNIPYSILTVDDFLKLKNHHNVICCCSKELLQAINSVNPRLRQLSIIYSAFHIDEVGNDDIKVALDNMGIVENYNITVGNLKKLSSIQTIPLVNSLFLIHLTNMNYEIEPETVKKNAKIHLKELLENNTRIFGYYVRYGGPQYYTELIKLLESFQKSCSISNKVSYKLFTFIGSMNAGGSEMYRRDFYNSLPRLCSYFADYDYKDLLESFLLCCRGWSEVCRILRNIQSGKKEFSQSLYKNIVEIVRELSINEQSALKKLAQLVLLR